MMNSNETILRTPVRAILTDDPLEILKFAIQSYRTNDVALATLVQIRGGGARALGAQIAVRDDGNFCGYVSGGCVEAAVAMEAMEAIAARRDRTVMFGAESPFFDIALPCGGTITVAIHVLRKLEALQRLLDEVGNRKITALRYCPSAQELSLVDPPARDGWDSDGFVTIYRPSIRLLVSNRSVDADAVSRVAAAAGLDVKFVGINDGGDVAQLIDPMTAVVLLEHDIEREIPLLTKALRSSAFYIGALGSTKTHRRRCDRLRAEGFSKSEITRLRAPVGMFAPTKDSASLAVSIVADVIAAKLAVYS